MADSNRITQSTLSNYARKLERAYLDRTPLLMKTKEKGKLLTNMGGLDLRWKVKTAKNPNFGSFDKFEKVNFSSTDSFVEASLKWGRYHNNDFLVDYEERQNRGERERIFDLKQQKIDDLVSDSMLDLQLQFWTGTGTEPNMLGLANILTVTNTTGSYAGISRTNTFWQHDSTDGDGYANSSFATDALIAIETAKLNATRDNAGGEPDWALIGKTGFAAIGNNHSINSRYVPRREREMGGGQDVLVVHGIEIYFDPNTTTSNQEVMYLMNSNFVEVLTMHDGLFELREERSLSPLGTAYYWYSYLCLRILNPRYFAVIHNVDN